MILDSKGQPLPTLGSRKPAHLEPCPTCGSGPAKRMDVGGIGDLEGTRIACSNCGYEFYKEQQ